MLKKQSQFAKVQMCLFVFIGGSVFSKVLKNSTKIYKNAHKFT